MKRTLVLGASEKAWRYSNMAIRRLKDYNHETCAIGRKQGIVEDVEIISEKFLFNNVDTVTMYLNPENQKDYYEYIVSIAPKRVIFNPGSENPELYQILEENKIEALEACTLVLLSANQY